MSDKLKEFIQENREQFDVFEPGLAAWVLLSKALLKAKLIASSGIGGSLFVAIPVILVSAATVMVMKPELHSENKKLPAAKRSEKTEIIHSDPIKEKAIDEIIIVPEKVQNPVSVNPVILKEKITEEVPEKIEEPVLTTEPDDSTFKNVKVINLNCPGFKIDIKVCSQDIVSVERVKSGEVKGFYYDQGYSWDLQTDQNNSELNIKTVCTGKIDNKLVMGKKECMNKILVCIPRSKSYKITNKQSDLSLSGFDGESLQLISESGDISLIDIKAKLNLDSRSGDIDLENISGDLSVHSLSGDHHYNNMKGNITCNIISGDFELIGHTGDISINTVSGDQFFKESKGNIISHCTSGDMNLISCKGNVDLETKSGDVNAVNLSIIDSCSVKTLNGDLNIDLNEGIDEYSFNLKTTHGQIKLNTIISEDVLVINAGPRKITAYTLNGNQIFR